MSISDTQSDGNKESGLPISGLMTTQYPSYKVLAILSLAIALIGLCGITGVAFNINILRGFSFSQDSLISPMAASCVFMLGVCLFIQFAHLQSRWNQLVYHIVGFLTVSSTIVQSSSYIYTYLKQADFNPVTPFIYNLLGNDHPTYVVCVCLFLLSIATGSLFYLKRLNAVMLSLCSIPSLFVFYLVLFSLVGRTMDLPIIYSFRSSLPALFGLFLCSSVILIGNMPYGGLLQPLFSGTPKARWFALLSFLLGFGVVAMGAYGVSQSIMYFEYTSLLMDEQNKYLFIMFEFVAIILAVLINTVGLRALYYFNVSTFYAIQFKQSLQREQKSNLLLKIISNAQNHFISNEKITSLFDQIANDLLKYTSSDYCLIGEIQHNHIGTPYLKCHYSSHAFEKNSSGLDSHFSDLNTMIEHIVNNGEALLTSDGMNQSSDINHIQSSSAPLYRLTLPLSHHNQVIGIICIANRTASYNPELIDELKPLLTACANIIQGFRIKTYQTVIEQELKTYANQLEESNRELEDFTSIASHDLQSPLRKIHTFSEQLRRKLSEQLNEEENNYFDRIQRSIEHMQRLINDLLQLSRVTRRNKVFETVNLNHIVQDVLQELEMQIQENRGKVKTEELITIEAVPTQMHQLFKNLIENALKYHKPDTPPVIEIHGEMVDLNHYRIVISDNGIGFEQKYAEKVFGIFERLHNQGDYEGTGIGLSICKRIVDRHNGTIHVKSDIGIGTEFEINLPMQKRISVTQDKTSPYSYSLSM